ncbi:zinc finger BED domain-containing protein 4-like [Aedes albopictus]|uniref:HAT C-terminal dimerisation domain-containing protein n=1 Tax=Aedes albopictus TaxID=7160 RepID=A0ABM1Y1I3_AEDAL
MADGTRKSPLRMTSFVPTRWNSEFHMIERFLELYQYIQIIMTDQDRAAEMIKVEEKRNLEDVVELLQPLHEVTEDLSGESYATVSRVLPIINCLNNCISSIKPTSPIGRNLQTALQREIKSRFGAYRDSPVYGPSMFLDPRFKEVHFKTSGQRDKATEIIIDMVLPEDTGSDNEEFYGEEQPPRKIPAQSGVWSYHEGMVQRYNDRRITTKSSGTVRKEIEKYLKCGMEPMTSDVFQYWEDKKHMFPFLYQATMKLLPRIATSVPSERSFSKTGRILN